MFRDWPFFTALIENAELSLAKADPSIADLYLARRRRDDLAAHLRDEMDRTTERVPRVAVHLGCSTAGRSCSRPWTCGTPTSTPSRSCSCGSSTGAAAPSGLVQATVNGSPPGLRNTG